MKMHTNSKARLAGLDLARYFAFAGMVCVNFKLAIHPQDHGPDWLRWVFEFLEGKASATFVVLSGLSLALATKSLDPVIARIWTVRRAILLLIIGLINLQFFSADIIHYYAFYFLFSIPWLYAGKRIQCISMLGLSAITYYALLHFDYSAGWNWEALQYDDFWTKEGFIRNLFFNGFHPILPWLVFFLYGIYLSHRSLKQPREQILLISSGLLMSVAAVSISALTQDSPWSWLLRPAPLPPGPVYLLLGIGTASIVIGLCLLFMDHWSSRIFNYLLPAGRMTLTLYLAHIFIGMGLLQELGAMNSQWSLEKVAMASLTFLLGATILTWGWNCTQSQGPVEILMRKLTKIK